MLILSLLAHHPEAGDPDLLDWIKHQLDAMIGLGPGLIVIGVGLLLVSIPSAIILVYMAQRRKGYYRDS